MAHGTSRILRTTGVAILLAACAAQPTTTVQTNIHPTSPAPTGIPTMAPAASPSPDCPGNLPSDPTGVCRKVVIPTETVDQHPTQYALGSIDASSASRLRLLFTESASWEQYTYGDIVFSPDDRFVALASSQSPLFIFSLPWVGDGLLEVPSTGLPSRNNSCCASGLAFNPDSRQLALALPNDGVLLVNPSTGENEASLGPISQPGSVAYVEDGTKLVVDTFEWPDSSIQLWDIGSASLIKKIAQGGVNGRFCDVAVSPDGRILAASHCLYSYRVRLWNIAAGYSPLTTLYGLYQPPYDCGHCSGDYFRNILQFAPDSRTIASANGWEQVVMSDPRTGKLNFVLGTGRMVDTTSGVAPGPIANIAFSGDSQVLVIAAGSELQLRNLRDGAFLLHTENPPGTPFGSIAMSPDSRLLVTVDWDGTVGFWGVPQE